MKCQQNLVALYFACDGGSGEDGRVILLSKTGADYYLEEPSSPAHRVLAQKSIFVRPHRGFVDPDHIVIVPSDLKWNLLDYLRDCHDISTATVYNDLNGFIRHQGIHRSAYTEFYQGMACQQIEDYRRAIEHYDRALGNCSRLRGRVGLQSKFRAWLPLCKRPDGP